jgi:hypothetical protein
MRIGSKYLYSFGGSTLGDERRGFASKYAAAARIVSLSRPQWTRGSTGCWPCRRT